MKMARPVQILVLIAIIAATGYFVFKAKPKAELNPELSEEQTTPDTKVDEASALREGEDQTNLALKNASQSASTQNTAGQPDLQNQQAAAAAAASKHFDPDDLELREFKVEDGVAVIDGDIVIGKPTSGAQSGVAQIPTLQLWPSRVIPYFIQPSLKNPERIHEALRLFSSSSVAFVPYSNQEDVLVFQPAEGTCKSYVGRIGGKQPLWISSGCGPSEIAHEIMHALGFTHEQNRFDRDRYIRIHQENIEPDKISNFTRLPENFMQASGLDDFSYTSIMIYAPDVFSRNGSPTMTSLSASSPISPSAELDRSDLIRLQRSYGNR